MKKKPKSSSRRTEGDPPERRLISNSTFTALLGCALMALPMVALADVTAPALLAVDQVIQTTLWPVVALLFLLIGLNSLFVAAETSVDLLRPSHARALKETEKSHQIVESLLEKRAKVVASLTLCRQTIQWWTVISSFIPALGLARVLEPGATSLTVLRVVECWLAVGIPIAALNMVCGELVPKAYASHRPVAVVLRLNPFIRLTTLLFSGPSMLLAGLANIVTQRFGARASFVTANVAEEEIKSLADTAEQSGELEKEERELLHSVFEFGETIAREIMTPRVDMDAASITSTPADLVALIQETGRSRIPVYEETDDQIIGIIHAKDLLDLHGDPNKPFNLRTLIRPVIFVPENKNIDDLLRELRASRSQMAIVQDEFGGTAGLVTIEDIVEELVGEIVDEYDTEDSDVAATENGWMVNGRLNLDDLNTEIGSAFESDEFDTIGGFVFGLFGRQPKQGEQIADGGYTFHVEETDGRRIVRLQITRDQDAPVPSDRAEVI